MKSGALWVHCWGLAVADFGRDPIVATVWEAGEIFCPINNARFRRFPVGQISPNLNTTTSIIEAVTTFRTEFWKCYRKGSFFQKKFSTSGRYSPAMITDRRKFTAKWTISTGCLVFIFTVKEPIQNHSLGLYAPYEKLTLFTGNL